MAYSENLLEIELSSDDSFLKIRESLTRIGIASNKDKKIYQSCHILSTGGKYYIVHFKEMLKLDGRSVNFNEEDETRRTDIAKMIQEWGLCSIVDESKFPSKRDNLFRVLSFRTAKEWNKISKYQITGS